MMKHIIIDFMDRWKWWLAAGVAVQVGWIVWGALHQRVAFHLWPLLFCIGFLLTRDRTRGLEETFSLLPIPRKTQAAAYWVQEVLVPTGLVAVSLIIAFGISCLIGETPPVGPGYIPLGTLFSLVYSGMYSFVRVHADVTSMRGYRCLLQIVFGVTFGLLFIGIIINPVGPWSSLNPLQLAYLPLGAVCLALSWFLAKRAVRRRWERYHQLTEPVGKRMQARNIFFPDRKKCLREIWVVPAVFPVCLLAFVVLVAIVISAIAKGWGPLITISNLDELHFLAYVFPAMILPMFIVIMGIEPPSYIRLLRILPLKGYHLAFLILSVPLVACAVSTGTVLLLALAAGESGSFLIGLGFCTFETGAIALITSLGILSRNTKMEGLLTGVVVILFVPAIFLVRALGPAAGVVGVGSGLVLLAAAVMAAILFISRSSAPYCFVEPAPVFMPPGTVERMIEWDQEMKKRRKKQQ